MPPNVPLSGGGWRTKARILFASMFPGLREAGDFRLWAGYVRQDDSQPPRSRRASLSFWPPRPAPPRAPLRLKAPREPVSPSRAPRLPGSTSASSPQRPPSRKSSILSAARTALSASRITRTFLRARRREARGRRHPQHRLREDTGPSARPHPHSAGRDGRGETHASRHRGEVHSE